MQTSYVENKNSSFQQRVGESDKQPFMVFLGMQHPPSLSALKILT